jgi:hypothetical protein
MTTRSSFALLVLLLVLLASGRAWAQDKPAQSPPQPKIVLDLEKSPADRKSFPLPIFGQTCHSSAEGARHFRVPDHPTSILELFGARVEVVKIRSYARGWKSPDEVRKHVSKLLQARTAEVSPGAYWAEMVYPDIVAMVQFSDKSEGTLEESRGHVCFIDHSHTAYWVRIGPIK